jgi:hypothetical protein
MFLYMKDASYTNLIQEDFPKQKKIPKYKTDSSFTALYNIQAKFIPKKNTQN